MIAKLVVRGLLPKMTRFWREYLIMALLCTVVGQWQVLEKRTSRIGTLETSTQMLSQQLKAKQAETVAWNALRHQLQVETVLLKQQLGAQQHRAKAQQQIIMNQRVPQSPEGSLNWLEQSIDSLDWDTL